MLKSKLVRGTVLDSEIQTIAKVSRISPVHVTNIRISIDIPAKDKVILPSSLNGDIINFLKELLDKKRKEFEEL